MKRKRKDPTLSRDQARWLLMRLEKFRHEAREELKRGWRPDISESEIQRSALARFEGMLQHYTGDYS